MMTADFISPAVHWSDASYHLGKEAVDGEDLTHGALELMRRE